MNPLRSVGARLGLALAVVVAGALILVDLIVVPSLERNLINANLTRLEEAAPTAGSRLLLSSSYALDDTIQSAASSADARVVYFKPLTYDPPMLSVNGDSSAVTSTDVENDPLALRAFAEARAVHGTVTSGGVRYAEAAYPLIDGSVVLLRASLHDSLRSIDLVRSRLVVAGLIASVGDPGTFTVLFAIDCVTFLGYMLVLARVRAPALHEGRLGGSWRAVLRDRVFTLYTLLNAAFMTAAISVVVELLPAFGKNVAGISEKEVGIVFALDAVGVAIFQLPVVKLSEGRSRMRGFALMGTLWAASLLAVWAAGSWTRTTEAFGILAAAVLVFAVGECLHGAIHAPLSVDLAPPQLVGRYTAAASISWQIGWILGPAAGGFLLQHRPLLLWPIAAGVNLACAAAALALEPRLPERVRRTPRAEQVALPIPASG